MRPRFADMARRASLRAALGALTLLALRCGSDGGASGDGSPLRHDDRLAVGLMMPLGAGPGLEAAGVDLREGMAAIAGVPATPPGKASSAIVVRVVTGEATAPLGDQGFRLTSTRDLAEAPGLPAILVECQAEIGCMYGLYTIAADLGVRYVHPEQTVFPEAPDARLPVGYDGHDEVPHFALRGFHEHTQHPIVMSDVLLRPNVPGFREMASRYLRWLARNRQNVLYFHLLKTVDMAAWTPWMQDITSEARGLGIGLGAVIGFADQQQNAFKMIRDDDIDPATGQRRPDEEQIARALDRVLASGLSYVGFQIGTSEFTKPPDGAVLGWLDAATRHVTEAWPDVRAFAWIHITCGLEADSGQPFYHLPLQAPDALGAFVHTTMFYTLTAPAPVYDCEDFTHQLDFLDAASGERPLVFFPETAWWLGFDDNVPLTLPITGWSRAHDVQVELAPYEVEGHVTFSTGREWGYWMYDHHLTRLTWDADVSWEDYLDWIEPVFGDGGEALMTAERAWTDLQRKWFYDTNPLLIFYLSGELPQDEIGAQAGILARRPKLAYRTVRDMDDATFAAWQTTDLDALRAMLADHEAVLAALPADSGLGKPQQLELRAELRESLELYVDRIQQAIALYESVAQARAWKLASAAEDASGMAAAKQAAEAALARAQAVTARVLPVLKAAESRYRYPVELLAREKPASLTSYPFGYLAQTSTGYFWTRRDEQLAAFLEATFTAGQQSESWETAPAKVFVTDADHVTLTQPENPVAGGIITSFMPRILMGGVEVDPGLGTMTLVVAEDTDQSGLPDPDTETAVSGTFDATTFTAQGTEQPIRVHDSAGTMLGTLRIQQPAWTIAQTVDASKVATLTTADLAGSIATENLVDIVLSVGGIDREGVENLVKSIYGVDPADPLPASLPFAMRFDLTPL
ncbi:MAG: hypothetical protein H6746_20040 [Deltaproteobacteria bacterium]|nr:hypothetical protein [Deltaproteobacteria bacterium]